MNIKARKESKHETIVSKICIQHAAFAGIKEELEYALDSVNEEGNPVCLLITGESRTGKSKVVREVLDGRMHDDDGGSVVYAIAPPKATTKSLLESLLQGLGDPYWNRGSESSMTQRLYTMLRNVKCRMIILDEFQHLCDKGQRKQLAILSDWIKVLVERAPWGLVAVGMPESASIVHCHPQLKTRFQPELRMPIFDWTQAPSRTQYKGILKQFRLHMAPFELPQIESQEMALRMYLATAGRIGLVARLLNRAVEDAVRQHRKTICLEDLQAAYSKTIWGASTFPVRDGPFLAAITALEGTNVMASVMRIAASESVADTSASVEVHGMAKETDPQIQEGSDHRRRAGRPATKRPASRRAPSLTAKQRRELGRAL